MIIMITKDVLNFSVAKFMPFPKQWDRFYIITYDNDIRHWQDKLF